MCGRYSLANEFSELRLGIQLALFPPYQPRYNIAPTAAPGFSPPIVRKGMQNTAEALLARWWFIPHWWEKGLTSLPTSFNARSEQVADKPLWRDAFERRRCLVPATGWREFSGKAGSKRAFQFHTGEPFAFAGVTDTWTSPDGEVVDSFSILTAAATDLVRPIHDRMPLIMPLDLQQAWLLDDSQRVMLLNEAVRRRDDGLRVYESSAYGNSVRHEGPECIAPATVQGSLF